ncbi:CBS domain-containing protein [archaeon]|nr:CBS domain-containing protein [archaeon]
MNSTFVNEIMNKNVTTVDKSLSLQQAADEMKKSNIGCVIITDKTKPVGIITERDFVSVAANGIPLLTDVYEVMSSPLITIDFEETVWEASETMKEKGIHKLPVIQNEQIVGIITTTDIVRISSVGSDSEMRRICDQILLKMKNK